MYAHILSYIFPAARMAFLVTLLCLGVVREGYGQQAMERVYADGQSNTTLIGGFINDAAKAHDHDIFSYSTIGVALAGSVRQELIFSQEVSGNIPVRIKIGTGTNILSLLSGISVQAFLGNTAIGTPQTLNNLITLLSGADQAEVIIIPSSTYDRVRISTSGIALGGGLNIYEAYYYRTATSVICDQPIDILYGTNGAILGGLNIVQNPALAIDGNITTAAVLNGTANLANKTHLTSLYSSHSQAGDSVRVIFRNPGGLLQANLLSTSFSIRTYNDNQSNGPLALDQSILKLSLLAGSSNIQVLTYPVNAVFNRVEISLGSGLLNALQQLEVYEIQRVIRAPEITAPSISEGAVSACEDESISLSIVSPTSGYEYRWYTVAEGGSPVVTSTSYTTPSLVFGTTYTYYVSASLTGCLDESARNKIVVNVLPQPGKPHLTITDIQN
ncbi:hypothetical protein [Parapedobacter lycopersici]|uniref:immunoglobulin domain-containing protein n=1 Tax=Parapedobacter lycopersici TaxID=1864939 RepID=UPI00333EDA1F